MPGDRMITLATFHNPIEAELAKNRLEAEGIRAFLSGDTASNMFGAPIGLAIALLVNQVDAERADQVLAALPRPGDRRHEFLADAARAAGEEENGDNSAIQAPEWARGEELDENDPEAQYRAADLGVLPARPLPKLEPVKPRDSEAPPIPRDERPSAEEEDEDEKLSAAWRPDDYASRALKAAIIGPLICGGILNFYSICLLARLAVMEEEPSAAGMRKVYGALAIDSIVVGALLLLFLSMMR